MKEKKDETTLIGIGLAIIATFFSKGFGFLREALSASVFGTSSVGDAFIIALSIPDILVTGFSIAVTTIYVPTYYKVIKENKNSKTIAEFNTNVMALLILIGIGLFAVIEAFPEAIVSIFAGGFNIDTMNKCVSLLRVIAFSIVPIFLSSFFKAYGQIINRYNLLTFLSCIINISIIAAMITADKNLYSILPFSVVLGNLLYAIISWIVIHYSFKTAKKITFNNKYIRGMLLCIIPVFISNIIAEINQIIDKNFASQLVSGSISALNYSSKIINLITAVFGTAISSILFSKFSKLSINGNDELLSSSVKKINLYLLTILMPLFWGIIIFAELIVKALFGYGDFNDNSIKITTECLIFYSIGIIGFNFKAIWVRIYNASLDTKTPAVNSVISIIINIILNILFIGILKHKGLALATGISSLITDILLIVKYKKINNTFNARSLALESAKILMASIIYLLLFFAASKCLSNNIIISFLIICCFMLVGTIIYIFLLIILHSDFGNYIKSKLRQF